MSQKLVFPFLFALMVFTATYTPVFAAESCPYKLPWASSLPKVRVSQSISDWTNKSHKPWTLEEFAIDFALKAGTPVLAARGGILSNFHDGETRHGDSVSYAKYANFVIINHGDGTYGVYYHLQNTTFSRGDIGTKKIAQGELIGQSGNTGWSTNAHLHFQVQFLGNKLAKSIPFCFSDVPGGIPKLGEMYTSENQLVTGQETKPTETKRSQPTATAKPEQVDKSSPGSIAKWLSNVITKGNFAVISQLIGSKGAVFTGYSMGLETIGHNNGEEIAKTLGVALANSNPVCMGYWVEEDGKLHILFSDADLDEQTIGFSHKSDITLFLFLKSGNRFELRGIIPVDNYGGWEIDYETSNLSPCG